MRDRQIDRGGEEERQHTLMDKMTHNLIKLDGSDNPFSREICHLRAAK